MKYLHYCILFIVIISIGSCKTPEKIMLEDYKEPYLLITEGGGFTGLGKMHLVTKDAFIYSKAKNDSSFVFVKRVDQKFINNMFRSVEQYALYHPPLKNPGNIYKSIELRNDSNQSFMWTWDASKSNNKNSELNTYYSNIIKSISNEK